MMKHFFKALKTIKETSVEPERAFSALGFFVTKITNRMSDKTLESRCFDYHETIL